METKKEIGNALKQALERRQEGNLPSNFTFRMMERVREEAAKQRKRREQTLLWAVILGALSLISLTVYLLVVRMDFSLKDRGLQMEMPTTDFPLMGFYCYIALLALVLLGLDYYLRRHKRRAA